MFNNVGLGSSEPVSQVIWESPNHATVKGFRKTVNAKNSVVVFGALPLVHVRTVTVASTAVWRIAGSVANAVDS